MEIANEVVHDCQENEHETDIACVVKGFANYLTRKMDVQAIEMMVREKLATSLETYSCTDNAMKSSEPVIRTK